MAIVLFILAFVAGIVLYIVSMFDAGLKVKNFGWAMIIGFIISFFSIIFIAVVEYFMTIEFTGIWLFISHAFMAAIVIYIVGKLFKEKLEVDGFFGAFIAALTMGGVSHLLWIIYLSIFNKACCKVKNT